MRALQIFVVVAAAAAVALNCGKMKVTNICSHSPNKTLANKSSFPSGRLTGNELAFAIDRV